MTTDLGDRMKANYEDRNRHFLTRRTPVIVRVDGRAFHTFTRLCQRPFDSRIITAMRRAAMALAEDMHGCKLAYVQSDEASFLLTDYDSFQTQAWFDYNQSKVESVSASLFAAEFNDQYRRLGYEGHKLASFDARAFNVPKEEVSNYFLWRAKDWSRNSVAMYTRSFSDRELKGKCVADQHEMLHGIGKNWTDDLSPVEKNGTFLVRDRSQFVFNSEVPPRYADIDRLVQPWMEEIAAVTNTEKAVRI